MDIGKEKRIIEVDPAQSPVPRRQPTPAPKREPIPRRQPAREPGRKAPVKEPAR